ncbi:MAG: hypothetical protein V4498_01160 [candidate division FCPU426 bacterium]
MELKKILRALSLGLLMLSPCAQASTLSNRRAQDNLMLPKDKAKGVDREALRQELTTTMDSVEALATDTKNAAKADLDEIWLSAKRDFRLKSGVVSAVRDSLEDLQKALDAEGQAGEAEAKKLNAEAAKARERAEFFRDRARSDLKSIHKNAKQVFLRDLRNWLIVADGDLRRALESRSKPTPEPAAQKKPVEP